MTLSSSDRHRNVDAPRRHVNAQHPGACAWREEKDLPSVDFLARRCRPWEACEPSTEGVQMPKFLFEASYTLDGVKGVQSAGGSSRREAVAQVAESVGGEMECFYFAFGDADAFVIVDLPDNESAAAVALTVNAAGGATVRTTVLLTPEDVDAAAQRSVDYRPPGA
jgi:uncharacterized protein with GYD domain